ncbi:MAG: V-type ATP synthase subunit I, partial [Candidatus Methanospirareceae archaeon]
VYASVGTCPEEAVEAIIADLEEITSGLYYFNKAEIIKEKKEEEKEYACVIACFNEHAEEVLARLRRAGFEKIEVGGFEKKPKEEIKEIEKKIGEKERAREEVRAILAENAERREGDFLASRELLRAIEERANIQRNFVETERAFSLTGWVPAENAEVVSKEINKISGGLCVVDAVSPEPDEEKVPVLLKNPKFFKSFELFIKLYGIPKYGGIDPTILFTVTFIFFSAFMLGDAIYGLICAILGFLLLRGAGKYNVTIKDFSIIFISFGLASFVIGSLTGGWLGDLFTERHFNIVALKSIMIADQLKDVLLFLIFSIIIGIIHLDLGIMISKYESRHNLKDFMGGDLWFLVAQIGLIPLLITYRSYGTWFRHDTPCLIGVGLLAISLALLLFARKGMSLFGITGFLGDTLSYARLMALGLCTYGIALAVNVLAGMCYGIAYIGIIAAVLIFVIGHLVNLVLQVLGSFVHGLRLHYVEFFSKFYITGEYEDEYKPFELKIKI